MRYKTTAAILAASLMLSGCSFDPAREASEMLLYGPVVVDSEELPEVDNES